MAKYTSKRVKRATSQRSTLRPSPNEPLPASQPLPLYAFLEDLRRGFLPNNAQVIQSLQGLQHSALLSPTPGLSENGRQTINDLSQMASLMVRVMKERNGDQLLQRFLYHAGLAAKTASQQMLRSGKVPIVMKPRKQVYLFGSRDAAMATELRQLRKQATKDVRALYSLGQLLLTSTDFRQMLRDWQGLAERVMQEDVGVVGERGGERGGEEREGGFGKGTAQKWHYEEKEQTVPASTVRFSQSRPLSPSYAPRPLSPLGGTNIDQQIEELRQRVGRTQDDISKLERGETLPFSGGSGWERPTTEQLKQEQRGGIAPRGVERGGEQRAELERGGEQRAEQSVPRHLPEERLPIVEIQQVDGHVKEEPRPIEKSVPVEYRDEGAGVTPPQERPSRNQQILMDAKPLLLQLAKNEQFRMAITELMALVTRFRQTTTLVMADSPESPALVSPALGYDANLQAAQMDLIRLVERFAHGASIDPALEAMNRMRRNVERDYQLKDWVGDWQAFLRRCLSDPAYLEHEEYCRRGEFLLERTRELSQRRQYREQFTEASDAIRRVVRGLGEDPLTQELGQCLTRLLRDDLKLAFGANPWAALAGGETLNDLRIHWLPALLRSVHEIPLPRIESHTDGSVLVLEDVVIPAESLMPADLDVRTQGHFRANPRHKLLGRFYNTKAERTVAARSGWTNSTRIRL